MKSTAPRPAIPREVQALRTSLDSRLTALEKALADPKQHGSLEGLILDLARIATEEADATARHAVLDAQTAGQSAAAVARTEAVEELEAEKVESAALRQVIEQAKGALMSAEMALKEERRAAESLNREAAAAQRELAVIRETLEQQQSAGANQRRELDTAHAAVETERARASSIEEQVAQTRAQGESESAALARELEQQRAALDAERASAAQLLQARSAVERDLATVRDELSASRGQLDAMRGDLDSVRRELDASTREMDATRAELDVMRGERDATREELASTRHDLETVRRELDSGRQDADARTQTLSQSQAEHEQALKMAHDAARSTEAHLDQASRERDAARGELDTARHELDTTRHDLDAAHDGARSAEAQLAQAISERDTAQNETIALKRDLEMAESAIHERDELQRELMAAHAAHEARDTAEALQAARVTVPDADVDLESETVVDLTSATNDDERQLAIDNRIRALELALRDAEMRAESAELELDAHLRPARIFSPPVPAEPIVTTPVPDATEEYRGPARASKRVTIKGETEIQIDGAPGTLVDLSLTGAQVLTASAMKPNRLITVTLPVADASIVCKGKVMWARIEPRSGQLWYRAGVAFTSADQGGLQTLLALHQK